MSNSIRDQLLKAGLITREQLDKATQPPAAPPAQKAPVGKRTGGNPALQPARTGPTPKAVQQRRSEKPKENNDLARFYQARAELERNERAEQERLQREQAARRKQYREHIRSLILENLQNVDDAEIRYHFRVGDNVKSLYVTEAQQGALADGRLAITFLEGKRCLIPAAVARQIQELDPGKVMVLNAPDNSAEVPATDTRLEEPSEPAQG